MSVLVAGGAGYIGSHTVAELMDSGRDVVVIDNLQKGHREAVLCEKFYHADLQDEAALDAVFRENDIDSVIDFAADSLVGESVSDPLKYYANNVGSTITLLGKMRDYGVKYIVFSSTAAVYGEPQSVPILESSPTRPTNPYGQSKLAVEQMLHWVEGAHGIHYAALRYFNAAGAHIGGQIGEDHKPESHLIPLILQAALGKASHIGIFGDDYDTPDGTCVRDYIHATDLANAHILALDKIKAINESRVYNLGNGRGFSVMEVLEMARKITGRDIRHEIRPRRAGDPATLIASSKKIKNELSWSPRYDSLETIVKTAWDWHLSHPDGFGD